MLWPMATTDYLRRTGSVPVASWRRANSWWTHIYWESTIIYAARMQLLRKMLLLNVNNEN
jgi:hypothetical protein